MRTIKQQELLDSFLSALDDAQKPIYQQLAEALSANGYEPRKEGSALSFKHTLHNKQMAKMGFTKGKRPHAFFALRFSACEGYSQRYSDIVKDIIERYPNRSARCVNGECSYCSGIPFSHVYLATLPDGGQKAHCGAYALRIPDVTREDVGEIIALIEQEHAYLMAHEAGGAVSQ